VTWFAVDDKFWSHPKTLGISLSAVGVWTLAGSWCSSHLTDGYIPADALAMVCRRKTTAQVQELVERNLWTPMGDGWQFVDWSQWQKSKTEVEAKRAATRARQEAYRQRQKSEGVTRD
jgi:hypothetical protein